MHGFGLYEGLAIAGWDFVEMILLLFMLSFFGSCDVWSSGGVDCDGGKVGCGWLSAERMQRVGCNSTAIFSAVEGLGDQDRDAQYCCLEYR